MKRFFLSFIGLQCAEGAMIVQFKKGVSEIPQEFAQFTQSHGTEIKPMWNEPRFVTQVIATSVWDKIKRQPNLALRSDYLDIKKLRPHASYIEKMVEDRNLSLPLEDITPVVDPRLPCQNTIYIGGYSGQFQQNLGEEGACDGYWLFPEEGIPYIAHISGDRTLEIYEGGQLIKQGKGSLSFSFAVGEKSQILVVRGAKGKYSVDWKPENRPEYIRKSQLNEISNAFGFGSIEGSKAYTHLTGVMTSKSSNEKHQGAYMMNVGSLWQQGVKGLGVRIGVIDTGADFSHPFLKDVLEAGINVTSPEEQPQDDEGHGTHVSGIIHQIAPLARIVPIKVLDRYGSGSVRDIVAGINWAIEQKLQVLNLSIGGDLDDEEVFNALKRAEEAGILVAMAAGNDSSSTPTYPARYTALLPNLGFAVGALNLSRELTNFSDRSGNEPNMKYVAAFGTLVNSSMLGGGYKKLSGTSMAAPQVSGLFALFKSLSPNSASALLLDALRDSVQLTSVED